MKTELGTYLIDQLLPSLGASRYALAAAIGCTVPAVYQRLAGRPSALSREALARGLRTIGASPSQVEHALDLDTLDRGIITIPRGVGVAEVRAARLALMGVA